MASAKLSVTGAEPGIKRLDVAPVVLLDTVFQKMVFVPVVQLDHVKKFHMTIKNSARMKDQWKNQTVNQETAGKPEDGERDTEARTKEITQETHETPENPDTPKNPTELMSTTKSTIRTGNMEKILNLVRTVTVEPNTTESGEKLMDTDAMECLDTSLMENMQRSGATVMREKANGSRRRPFTKTIVSKNVAKTTKKNDHAARVSDHAVRASDHAARATDHAVKRATTARNQIVCH